MNLHTTGNWLQYCNNPVMGHVLLPSGTWSRLIEMLSCYSAAFAGLLS